MERGIKINKYIFVTVFILVFNWPLFAQNTDSVLNFYIREGMKSNISLQQQELSYRQSLAALEEAKAAFLPKVSLNSQFTTASGQNIFGLEVQNDLDELTQNLNLINQTLAKIAPQYPELPPYQFDSKANDFLNQTQQTFFRIAMPVFNTAIIYNHQIKQDLVEASDISVDIYKRTLVNEIKKGYYNYLKTEDIHKVLLNAKELAEENFRTTKSLVAHEKVTIDQVYKAEANVLEASQKLAAADKNLKQAKAYFNFLLNRKYTDPVETASYSDTKISYDSAELNDYISTAVNNREELKQMDVYLNVNEDKILLTKGNRWPELSVAADYGIRGNEYSFTSDDDFVQFSANFKWNIFTWNENRSKIQQAELDWQKTNNKRQQLLQNIELEVINAYYELIAAEKSIRLARQEIQSSEKAFKLVNRKYGIGQANLLEYKEAQTQFDNAQIKAVVAHYNYRIKKSELERVTGSYKLVH